MQQPKKETSLATSQRADAGTTCHSVLTTRRRDKTQNPQALPGKVRLQTRQAVPAGGRCAALDADNVLLVKLHALAALQALHLGHIIDDLRAQGARQAVVSRLL